MKRALAWVGAAALAAVTIWALTSRSGFEDRARDAEAFAADQRRNQRVLEDEIARLTGRVRQRDTVILERAEAVREADSTNPPPDTCRPNLAARDALIAEQAAQIADLKSLDSVNARLRRDLVAARDSLAAALGSRPRGLRLWVVDIGPPVPGAFAGVGLNGRPTAGVGITLPVRIGGRNGR